VPARRPQRGRAEFFGDQDISSREVPAPIADVARFRQWARYVVKVFDETTEWIDKTDASSSFEWTEEVVYEIPGGRRQVKFQVAREAGRIRQIEIEQVRLVGEVPQLKQILRLDRDGAQRFIDVVTALRGRRLGMDIYAFTGGRLYLPDQP
jgi:hypothetical protein